MMLEGVGPSAPASDAFYLGGQLAFLEVLRRRVAAHAGLERGYPCPSCLGFLAHQLSHLRIRYHFSRLSSFQKGNSRPPPRGGGCTILIVADAQE